MSDANTTATIEKQLREWAKRNAERDDLVKAAHKAKISKNRIHTLTGISRSTIDRILAPEQQANAPASTKSRTP